jgi:hypothetical protein
MKCEVLQAENDHVSRALSMTVRVLRSEDVEVRQEGSRHHSDSVEARSLRPPVT